MRIFAKNTTRHLAAWTIALVVAAAGVVAGTSEAAANGCVLGVCGSVVNRAKEGIHVAYGWNNGPRNIKYLPPGGNTTGSGDVDAFQVPAGCTATLELETWGKREKVVRGPGWHRIRTNQVARIGHLSCRH